MDELQLEREKWADEYNNSLPIKKWYCKESKVEMSIAIGGIYDSEYMCYVFENVDLYGRIKKIKNEKNIKDK